MIGWIRRVIDAYRSDRLMRAERKAAKRNAEFQARMLAEVGRQVYYGERR